MLQLITIGIKTDVYAIPMALRDLTHEVLSRFCNIDYDREMVIKAEYTQGGTRRNVGVERLIIEPSA